MNAAADWRRGAPLVPKPKRSAYTATGGTKQARLGRRLLRRTQRLVKRKDFAAAGEHVMSVSAQELSGVEVRCERVGLQWQLALDDVPQRTLFAMGSFDELLVAWVIGQLRDGDTVVDIGAHVGLLSVQFANRLRDLGTGRVVSFEPAPDSARRLRAHAELNGLADRITLVEAAVGDESGTVTLRMVDPDSGDDPSLRSLYGSGEAVATDVPLVRFDDWWNDAGRPALDVVKIDVEGGELAVVNGMATALREARPRLLVVEVKEGLSAMAGVDPTRVVQRLAELGYANQGVFSHVAELRPMPYLDENLIFVREDAQ